jgi:uncharacterized damage-inducible protein DinB
MQGKEMLQTLYAYNIWANRKIFEAAARLEPSQWDEPNQVVERTLHVLLYHIVRTEWGWRQMVQTRGQLTRAPQLEEYPTLASLREFEEEESRQIQAYLSELSEADLTTSLDLIDRSGKEVQLVIWRMLAHAVLHSMQHRSEAAAILTHLGQSPGDIDFIYFV